MKKVSLVLVALVSAGFAGYLPGLAEQYLINGQKMAGLVMAALSVVLFLSAVKIAVEVK